MSQSDQSVEKVIILGSGPAGLTAALYTARADLSPLLLEGIEPGGQLMTTTDVENFPGFVEGIMGPELMDVMKQQVTRFGTRFALEDVIDVDLSASPFTLTTSSDKTYRTEALIIATGATARYLGLPNELRLRGHGVSACATCDGFFFRGDEVVVIGGGDSACEEAGFLAKFASKVHLLVRRDVLRASKIMQKRVLDNDRIEIHWSTQMIDVLGEGEVAGVRVRNSSTGVESDWEQIKGVFLAIGHTPNSAPFLKWLEHDEQGYLITAPGSSQTSVPGVFACGDVQDHTYRQAITAAGSGCMAAIDTERWLEARHA